MVWEQKRPVSIPGMAIHATVQIDESAADLCHGFARSLHPSKHQSPRRNHG